MAELNTGGGGGDGKKVRSKKMSTRVDLTAMVDLAFLLITFFMLTTTLAKPKAMDLKMPDKSDKDQKEMKVDDRRTMNIILGMNDKVEWYMGAPDKQYSPPQVVGFGKNGIHERIVEQMKKVVGITGDPKKGVIVLIKPTTKSHYKNLVDILDEMNVLDVQQFAIVDVTDPELELVKRDKIY
jgi:biopolymer transport protein ExbD